jgi:hypothetical protein
VAVWDIGGTLSKSKHGDLESDISVRQQSLVASTLSIVVGGYPMELFASHSQIRPNKRRDINQAWVALSSYRRAQLANTVAQFCKTVAILTSERLETAAGKGIVELFSTA